MEKPGNLGLTDEQDCWGSSLIRWTVEGYWRKQGGRGEGGDRMFREWAGKPADELIARVPNAMPQQAGVCLYAAGK